MCSNLTFRTFALSCVVQFNGIKIFYLPLHLHIFLQGGFQLCGVFGFLLFKLF